MGTCLLTALTNCKSRIEILLWSLKVYPFNPLPLLRQHLPLLRLIFCKPLRIFTLPVMLPQQSTRTLAPTRGGLRDMPQPLLSPVLELLWKRGHKQVRFRHVQRRCALEVHERARPVAQLHQAQLSTLVQGRGEGEVVEVEVQLGEDGGVVDGRFETQALFPAYLSLALKGVDGGVVALMGSGVVSGAQVDSGEEETRFGFAIVGMLNEEVVELAKFARGDVATASDGFAVEEADGVAVSSADAGVEDESGTFDMSEGRGSTENPGEGYEVGNGDSAFYSAEVVRFSQPG